LDQDLDGAIKEVKLLGEHEEESSQKITELEVLCKRLREDAHKLKEEKTALEGMIQSCDELIKELAEEYGLNLMGENDDDEDDDAERNAAAPPAPAAPAVVPEEIIEEETPMEMVPRKDAKPEPPQPHLINMIMRDYEECSPRM
jgi:peptidoglycan hydrolase CwlO-like protein